MKGLGLDQGMRDNIKQEIPVEQSRQVPMQFKALDNRINSLTEIVASLSTKLFSIVREDIPVRDPEKKTMENLVPLAAYIRDDVVALESILDALTYINDNIEL